VLHLRAASGRELLRYGFDRAIEGDFAVTEGPYRVGLSRENPLSGPGCLKVADSGGSHYGHVWMFNERIFAGPSNRGGDFLFSFDTADYPVLDFGLRSRAANADLALHILLDDGEPGYVVMLSGEFADALCPRKMIGRFAFVADGAWHRLAVDLDGLLDDYLGDIPHRVTGLKFGDTREMDFGWWTGSDRNEYFVDDFSIRKR
jgi:hypothetical protein